MRDRLPVDAASMREWLARPEWRYLIDFLREAEQDALKSLVAASASDVATIARAQAEIRFLRYFTGGEVAEGMKSELKEKQ